MEKYKKSKYLYYTKDLNNDLILCNFLDKTLYRYNKDISNKIITILNSEEKSFKDSLDKKIYDDLINKNFLVLDTYDEVAISNLRYLKTIFYNALQLIIIPTYRCNFSCPYCYQDHTLNTMNNDLCEGIIKYIRKNIKDYKEIHISWFGGEPLEAICIIENISRKVNDICRNRYKAFTASMTTNAFNLTEDIFELLLSLNIKSYQITIDGTKDTHDKQRFIRGGGKSFDTIINNLVNIKNKFRNRQFAINIRTNVSKDVLDNLSEYLLFMNDKFGDDKRFSFCFKQVGNWGGETIETFKDNLLDQNGIVAIYKKILDCKINSQVNLNCSMDALNTIFNQYCYAGKLNSFVLDPNGFIGKCTCDDISDLNKVGSFNSNGDFILDDNKMSKWIITDEYTKCSKCFMEAACRSSVCAASHITERKKSKNCPDYRNNIDNILKLISLENRYIEDVII